jgi:hypothetical protein
VWTENKERCGYKGLAIEQKEERRKLQAFTIFLGEAVIGPGNQQRSARVCKARHQSSQPARRFLN